MRGAFSNDGPPSSAPPSAEQSLDSGDLERVTLVEVPPIARYGRYDLLGRIAYGGMAEIFLAREAAVDEGAQRLMVIKRVLPHVAEDRHFVDMFVDEARLAMQLSHPSICHVYSFGQEEGTYYLAMEWVNGVPLSRILKRAKETGGLPIPIALKIIAQVAEALDYTHRACDAAGDPLGIVHRDVSPQNVMVSFDGVVKLLDFGIAKAESHSTRTEIGVIKGKFAYMSPQQCVGEPIDGRADIFALGLCLFEALSGRNPFKCKTEYETMTKIVGAPTPSLRERRPEVPIEIEQIVLRSLEKEPERRFQTAGEMQLALELAIAELGTVINAARIGEYVSGIFADEVRAGPQLDTRLSSHPPKRPSGESLSDPSGVDVPRAPVPGQTESHPAPVARRSRAGVAAFAVLAIVVCGALAAGGVLAWVTLGDVQMRPTVGDDAPGPVAVIEAVSAPVGSVRIDSVPHGAQVEFGDRGPIGSTPIELTELAPGRYAVALTLEGHRRWEGAIEVLADQRAELAPELVAIAADPRLGDQRPIVANPPTLHPPVGPEQPAAPEAAATPESPVAPENPVIEERAEPGRLSLNTRPWSRVYVGTRLLGTTPLGRVDVASGNVRLRLVDRDGVEHRRTVHIPPGGHVAESFDLSAP